MTQKTEIAVHRPVIITDGGPWATHDHACCVCHIKPSVLDLGTYCFQPCWDCQEQGFVTVLKSKLPWFVRLFIGENK